jgi:hypothetical protein
LLVIHSNLHLEALARPSTRKVLQVREHTQTPFSSIIFIVGLAFELIKEFGVCHKKKSKGVLNERLLKPTNSFRHPLLIFFNNNILIWTIIIHAHCHNKNDVRDFATT